MSSENGSAEDTVVQQMDHGPDDNSDNRAEADLK